MLVGNETVECSLMQHEYEINTNTNFEHVSASATQIKKNISSSPTFNMLNQYKIRCAHLSAQRM